MEWSSAQQALRQLVDINENKPGQTVKTRDEAVETEKAQIGKSDYREKTELETEQSGQLHFMSSSVLNINLNNKLI